MRLRSRRRTIIMSYYVATHTRVCSLCGAHTFCIRHFAPLKPTKKNYLALVDTKSYVEVLWCLSPKWSITTHMCHVQSMKCKQCGDAIISLLIRHCHIGVCRISRGGGGGQPFYCFFHAHAMGVRHAPRAFFKNNVV